MTEYDLALEQYFKDGEHMEGVTLQPSNDSRECLIDGQWYVVFVNCDGLLAVYEFDEHGEPLWVEPDDDRMVKGGAIDRYLVELGIIEEDEDEELDAE